MPSRLFLEHVLVVRWKSVYIGWPFTQLNPELEFDHHHDVVPSLERNLDPDTTALLLTKGLKRRDRHAEIDSNGMSVNKIDKIVTIIECVAVPKNMIQIGDSLYRYPAIFQSSEREFRKRVSPSFKITHFLTLF